MRVQVQSASYSETPKNAKVTFLFVPETQAEIDNLAMLLTKPNVTTSTFGDANGQLTASLVIAPMK